MSIFDQLKRDEGLRLTPYKDTVGKVTIGYGRNLDDVGISPDEAVYMLQGDVRKAVTDVNQHLPWAKDLDDARLGVLINLTFNMGIHGLMEFKNTLALIEEKDFDQAAEELLQSKWAEQTGARAHRLSIQLRSGEWQ